MNVLLDTCTFLWAVLEPSRLSPHAANVIIDPANRLFLSAASTWEIAVNVGLGRITLLKPTEEFVPYSRRVHRIRPLSLKEPEAALAESLPRIHKDPFDRILICQALARDLTLLTPDPLIRQYPGVKVQW